MWESVWRLHSRKWSCWVTERERLENTHRPSGSPVSLAAARRSAAECQCPLPCPRGLTVLGVVSPVCLVESDTFVVQFYINFPSCTGYTHITPNRKNSITLHCHPSLSPSHTELLCEVSCRYPFYHVSVKATFHPGEQTQMYLCFLFNKNSGVYTPRSALFFFFFFLTYYILGISEM